MYHSERLTLYEICQRIQETIYEGFPESIWIIAEIGEMKEHRTGHCYLELIEKNDEGGQPKAKARATIWGGKYRVLKPFFEMATGRKLSAGLKVLILCEVNYHPVYGLSLNIQDIDPNFTIGDLEKQKQETIQRLINEGIFDMNKQVEIPVLPKRVAIISSQTAAGYEDFINQLNSNPYGYKVEYRLFEATMQGEKAENSMVNALDLINQGICTWDLVAIIRGGGSQIDLTCFDGYNIASNIAQFPLPVITGIGHEKDTSVADLVAHTRLKTPTAAAEFIIGSFLNAENILIDIKDHFLDSIQEIVNSNKNYLTRIQGKIVPQILRKTNAKSIELHQTTHICNEVIDRFLTQSSNKLYFKLIALKPRFELIINDRKLTINNISDRVLVGSKRFIKEKKEQIAIHEKITSTLKPENVFKRGYSIAKFDGKIIDSMEQLKQGDIIETLFMDGKVFSKVTSRKKTID